MTSRCTIKVPGGTTTDADGFEVAGWTLLHEDLPLRVGGSQRGGSGSRSTTAGGVEVEVATRVAHLPAETAGLVDGAVIEITAGENVGGFLRVVEASWQDQATARRVPVIETQQPDGWS